MPDIATISTVLSSIKSATEIAKLIKDSCASLEQAEVKLQIAELISSLADAKIELASIQNEMLEKDRVISDLNAAINKKKSVVWDKPYYWTQEDESKDGPFCQHCYDKEQTFIRLQGGGTDPWYCQSCKNTVVDKNYVHKMVKVHHR